MNVWCTSYVNCDEYQIWTSTYLLHKQSTTYKFFFLVFSTSNFMSTNNNASVDSSVIQHLVSINISEEEVFESLKFLDPDKSSGIDTIGPSVLKKCTHFLCGPLHYLFVTSLSKHVISLDWCTHVITPVHKSGDKSLVNNYRHISLLSNTSKY